MAEGGVTTKSLTDTLGIRPVINASATLTKLGGSLMPPPVVDAMRGAAGAFIDLHELKELAGKRLAQLTKNEAATITSGAAAGIALSVAACIAGSEADARFVFPQLDGIDRKEVVLFKGQRNGYDYAAAESGATIIESGPSEDEFKAALSPNTACVMFFVSARWDDAAPPLKRVVEIAHAAGVPVIVDAAAQIPPISNLWKFTNEDGADLAIFSGGKGLRGPQPSGLCLGRQWIIDGIHNHGAPNQSFGRPMKVGKEEIAGLVAAVEWSLQQDEAATIAGYEESVRLWVDGLQGIRGISVVRGYPSEAGQPHGRAIVTFGPDAKLDRDATVKALWEMNPRIAVGDNEPGEIALNPQTLQPGEAQVVLDAMRKLLA